MKKTTTSFVAKPTVVSYNESMVFLKCPSDFKPKFEIVSCFCEHDGKILLLHRHDHKPQGDTWCVPGGKKEETESAWAAIQREISEETGLKASLMQLRYFDKVFVRYPELDFVYHIFHYPLLVAAPVQINETEHKAFCWAAPAEALEMKLIPDEDFCIKHFYKI